MYPRHLPSHACYAMMLAASSPMRSAPQLGQSPRCLHEKATRTSYRQVPQWQRTKPREKSPHAPLRPAVRYGLDVSERVSAAYPLKLLNGQWGRRPRCLLRWSRRRASRRGRHACARSRTRRCRSMKRARRSARCRAASARSWCCTRRSTCSHHTRPDRSRRRRGCTRRRRAAGLRIRPA
jgi:hypothetical protein